MSESYEPKLVHLPGTKLTPQVTLKRTLEDVREDKYKRRVDAYVIMPDGRTRRRAPPLYGAAPIVAELPRRR
jgi:hypothetical protein